MEIAKWLQSLGLGQYALAQDDLRHALNIADRAETHCMLGQALDAQGKQDDGIEEWARCIELVNTQKQRIEPRWLAQAMTAIKR